MFSLTDFEKSLDRNYEEKVVRRVLEAHKAISLSTYKFIATDSQQVSLQYGSPILTGAYRASHRIAIGSIDKSTTPAAPGAEERSIQAVPLAQVSAILNTLKPFSRVYISNSLPYSRKLEFGHSKFKAPDGIYGVTAEVIKVRFKNIKL